MWQNLVFSRVIFLAWSVRPFRIEKYIFLILLNGFSEKDIAVETSRHLSRAKTGDFSSTDVDSVLRIMPDPSHVIIHKGWFPDTFSDITDETFCFVSLDADLYAPTAAALPLFYERLSIGGVLLIHDVYSTQVFRM